MGNGQWAMGNGQWAMGNGQWALGIKEAAVSDARSNTILSMPHAPFPKRVSVVKNCVFNA
ncbi:hypothetical protein [Scytonema hofmannii]|uniref:hypothetical protein n=1 Tax=Scytonema hofmannii TaxID=34078 RepID=UPI0018EFE722|nr:hypothetical protein [Scytonema hofmannii]